MLHLTDSLNGRCLFLAFWSIDHFYFWHHRNIIYTFCCRLSSDSEVS